jgi:hypothetical protein
MGSSTSTLTEKQEKFRQKMLNPFLFWLYTFGNVPAGWIAGMRLKELNKERAITTIPFKWLNKNPFKSMYFAVQSMAAELSTASIALLAITDRNPSVATIIVDLKAEFPKRATGKTTFTCQDGHSIFKAVELAISSGQPQTVTAKTTGTLQDGTIVSVFHFTWSFKQRSR